VTESDSVSTFVFKADGTGSLTVTGEVSGTLSLIHGKKSNSFTVKANGRDVEQAYRIEDDGNEVVMPNYLGETFDGHFYNINPPKPISLVGTKWAAKTQVGNTVIEFKDKSTCIWYMETLPDFPLNNTYTLKGNEVTYTTEKGVKSIFFIEGDQFIMNRSVYKKQASTTPAPAAATPAPAALTVPGKLRRNVVSYKLDGKENVAQISHVEIEWLNPEKGFGDLKLTIYQKNGNIGSFTFKGGDFTARESSLMWRFGDGGWSTSESEGKILWLSQNSMTRVLTINDPSWGEDLTSPNRLIFSDFFDTNNDHPIRVVIELDGSLLSE
jgi:hypothetical protein